MEFYRTIGKEEHEKLVNGETIFPIREWNHARNDFPRNLKGVYLYAKDDVPENMFYNFMGGEYIVILDVPEERIMVRGHGWYASDIPDEDGCYGIMTQVNEAMIEAYSMKDVVEIINIKTDCSDGDDFYFLKEGEMKDG